MPKAEEDQSEVTGLGALVAWEDGKKIHAARAAWKSDSGTSEQWTQWVKEFTRDNPQQDMLRWARRRLVIFEQLSWKDAQECVTSSIARKLAYERARENAGLTRQITATDEERRGSPATERGFEHTYRRQGSRRSMPETIIMLAVAIREITSGATDVTAHDAFVQIHETAQRFVETMASTGETRTELEKVETQHTGAPADKATSESGAAPGLGTAMLAVACREIARMRDGQTGDQIMSHIRGLSTEFIELAQWVRIVEHSGPLNVGQIRMDQDNRSARLSAQRELLEG